jgi:hypothetical protein
VVVEWCGRAGVEGKKKKKKTELPKQALRTSLVRRLPVSPMAAQQVRGGKQSAAGADVQFSLAGEETVNIPLLLL